MALAIDASSPAATTVSGVSTTPISTASFNPPAGSILVVAFSANTASGVTPGSPTITDNLGTPLTYNLRQWKTRATAPTANGQVALWTAPVVSGGAMVVSVTTGTASGNQQTALKVWVITGQDTSTPVGATGKNASTSASSISQSYTGGGTGGWGFLVTCDWSALGNFTAGSGCTVDATGTVPTTQFSYGFARRTIADDTNGGSNSLNVSAAGSSTDLSWAWVEVLPPATAATFVPGNPGRRRLFGPPRSWRRRTASPVPAQVIIAAPAFVPVMVRARKVVAGLRRNRGFHPLGSRTLTHQQQPLRPRLKLPKLTRSRIANPVPAQVVVAAPAYPPRGWRARVKAARQVRGHTAVVVPPQTAAVVATYVPLAERARTKLVRLFRGRVTTPAHGHAGPPAPRARPKPLLRQVMVRRRVIASPPIAQTPPPLIARVRTKVVRLLRRQATAVTPVQAHPPRFAPRDVRRKLFRARTHLGSSNVLPAPVTPVAGPDIDITVARPRTAWTAELARTWTARTVRSRWATDNPEQAWTTGGLR